MRILSANRSDGRYAMSLAPESVSDPNPPHRDLLIDATLGGLSGDRLAAAAALAFGSYLRGVFSTEKPVSPRMAVALAEFTSPRHVSPSNISIEGTQFTGSGTTLVLDTEHAGLLGRNAVDRGQVLALDILPMTEWTGRLFSMDRLVVASNANLLASRRQGRAKVGPFLAVAVAFADEMHVSRIVLPVPAADQDSWTERATTLLAATGIDLIVVGQSELGHLDLVKE